MFSELPLLANLAAFLAAAAAVWFAGTRVTRYAGIMQRVTGIGEATLGMLLLGLVTALPETAVTVTASYSGNAALAVNNLLGGIALNVAILAAADAAVRRETLTSAVASATPLLQGTLVILMLAVVAASTVTPNAEFLGIGAWSWLILAVYVLSLALVRKTRSGERWQPQQAHPPAAPADEDANAAQTNRRALILRLVAGALAILCAGYVLGSSADALSEQTGLGASFFGAVFLAVSTSLPEITIVFSAVRMRRYAMAVGDIFGANLLGLALLFVVDAIVPSGAVLAEAGRFATFAATLGIAVTALFLAGLLERGHRMIMRMGIDSILVLATYAGGVAVLYGLR